MMKSLSLVVCLALCACASDEPGGGGDGADVLPKKGAVATDPTIVSATAWCYNDTELMKQFVEMRVDASDPMGGANLGTCAAKVAGATGQSTFGDGGQHCYPRVERAGCKTGDSIVVDLTVANDKGGVTTASVTVTLATPQ